MCEEGGSFQSFVMARATTRALRQDDDKGFQALLSPVCATLSEFKDVKRLDVTDEEMLGECDPGMQFSTRGSIKFYESGTLDMDMHDEMFDSQVEMFDSQVDPA